jgi:tetratricopeptide (TPR) repeat protein
VPGKEIVFETLTPAEYGLPAGTDTTVVLNSSYTPQYDTLDFNVLRNLAEDEQFIIDTLIINNIFNGFFYVADQSPVDGLRNSIYVEERGEDTINFLSPLSNSSIDFLLNEFEADAVISLEYYGMDYDYYHQSGEFEDVAYLLLDRFLLWRIYADEGLIKEFNMRDTLYYSGYGVNREDAINSLPDITDVVRESFWFAGEKFAAQLSPDWEKTRRSYFWLTDEGKDRSLDPTYLREIAADKQGLSAYKAYFNLSIYSEREGEIEKALEYMNKALEIRPNAALAKFYKKRLKEKVEQFQRLKQQL